MNMAFAKDSPLRTMRMTREGRPPRDTRQVRNAVTGSQGAWALSGRAGWAMAAHITRYHIEDEVQGEQPADSAAPGPRQARPRLCPCGCNEYEDGAVLGSIFGSAAALTAARPRLRPRSRSAG